MLTVATYNILHGYHSEKISENIKLLLEKGVDVLCLQEADAPFEKISAESFPKNWETRLFNLGAGGNLAMAWNTEKLQLKEFKEILLPTLEKPSRLQKLIRKNFKLQRGALMADFMLNGKVIRITNVHLSWEGGINHRLTQLNFLKQELDKTPEENEILAGDFNSFSPSYFRHRQGKKIQTILEKKWTDVFPDLVYSCDLSHSVPNDGWGWVAKLSYSLGIKMRSRLDYVFARGIKAVWQEMLDLPGSDHKPLIAKFDFESMTSSPG